jgi:hypothetical protein
MPKEALMKHLTTTASAVLACCIQLTAPLSHAQTPAAAPPTTVPTAAPAVVPTPPPAKTSTVVSFGKVNKQTVGKITDLDKGDNGCYITFNDDKKNEFVEVGTADMCSISPSPKGKRVEMTYKMETIPATSCGDDKKCTKTETLPIVIAIKTLD